MDQNPVDHTPTDHDPTGHDPTAHGPTGHRPTDPGAVHRVVIVGSGFGGLFAVRAFRRAPVQVTLIDRTNHHLFQPLLYQVATGILSEGEIAPATRDVLRRRANVSVVMAEVTDIDLAGRVVTAEAMGRPLTLTYDSLIVAAGVHSTYFGNDEFEAFAPGTQVHRRRPRAAGPHLRRLRGGRDRARPGGAGRTG